MFTGGFTGTTSLVSIKSTAFAKAIFFAPRMDLVKELVSLGDLFFCVSQEMIWVLTRQETPLRHTP